MGRFVIVFALGMLCALAAMVAIMGHWVIAIGALAIAAVVALVWLLVRGTDAKAHGTHPTDADPEHAKAVQYAMRNKSQHPGAGL